MVGAHDVGVAEVQHELHLICDVFGAGSVMLDDLQAVIKVTATVTYWVGTGDGTAAASCCLGAVVSSVMGA